MRCNMQIFTTMQGFDTLRALEVLVCTTTLIDLNEVFVHCVLYCVSTYTFSKGMVPNLIFLHWGFKLYYHFPSKVPLFFSRPEQNQSQEEGTLQTKQSETVFTVIFCYILYKHKRFITLFIYFE